MYVHARVPVRGGRALLRLCASKRAPRARAHQGAGLALGATEATEAIVAVVCGTRRWASEVGAGRQRHAGLKAGACRLDRLSARTANGRTRLSHARARSLENFVCTRGLHAHTRARAHARAHTHTHTQTHTHTHTHAHACTLAHSSASAGKQGCTTAHSTIGWARSTPPDYWLPPPEAGI